MSKNTVNFLRNLRKLLVNVIVFSNQEMVAKKQKLVIFGSYLNYSNILKEFSECNILVIVTGFENLTTDFSLKIVL